jgi:hypothetical protein
MFSGAPENHIDLVREIHYGDEAIVEAFGERYRGLGLSGAYSEGRPGEIFIGEPRWATPGTPQHELGHLVWNEVLTGPQQQRIISAYLSDQDILGMGVLGSNLYISSYGGSRRSDAWAEAYRYATRGPEGMGRVRATMNPEFATVLEEIGF